MASTSNCKYLLACIEESLHIYPPSPANHTRITPPEGIVLDGQHVPGGLAVGMPMYATFRSASNFRSPDRFILERWTGEPAYETEKWHALQHFSYGPRDCLGRATWRTRSNWPFWPGTVPWEWELGGPEELHVLGEATTVGEGDSSPEGIRGLLRIEGLRECGVWNCGNENLWLLEILSLRL